MSTRISGIERIVANMSVQVSVATAEPKRVFTDEALQGRGVIPGPVVLQTGAVVLPPRVLLGIGVTRTSRGRIPKGIVGVGRLLGAALVRQRER